MAPLALATDLRCLYAQHGLRATIAKVARRPLASLYSSGERLVLVKDLADVPPLAVEPTLRFERLGERHLPALHELNRRRCYTRRTRQFAADLHDGCTGMVAFRDDELVGYYWWVDADTGRDHRDLTRLGLGIELAADEVYGFDFFILAEHRGGGGAVEFLHAVESGLHELGYERLWGYVDAANRPARWLYTMRGYRPVRGVTSRTVLARRRDTHQSKETPGMRPIGMIDERRG